ncbi:MAG: flagellar biosynthetic protein FliO [Phycisphaerae bacterium]|nr:flagellar biosynthetic protein FliO [Phycisphaerae bacterium]
MRRIAAIAAAACTATAALGQAPAIERVPLGTPGRTPEQDAARGDARDGGSAVGAGRVVGSLAVVVILALGVGVGLKAVARRSPGLRAALGAGGRAPAGVLEVLGRYPVARGATLVLLRVDRRVLLLSQTSGGRLGLSSSFTTLCEMVDADDVASILTKARDDAGESMSKRFQSLLERFDRGSAGAERASVLGRGAAETTRGGIPVVDLTRRGSPQGLLARRLASVRGRGSAA